MGLYSHRFHHHTGTGPWDWVCPAGKRAVVKYIGALNGSANTQQLVAKIGTRSAWFASVPVNTMRDATSLHIVVYELEVFTMLTTDPAMTAMACGFLFDDP